MWKEILHRVKSISSVQQPIRMLCFAISRRLSESTQRLSDSVKALRPNVEWEKIPLSGTFWPITTSASISNRFGQSLTMTYLHSNRPFWKY